MIQEGTVQVVMINPTELRVLLDLFVQVVHPHQQCVVQNRDITATVGQLRTFHVQLDSRVKEVLLSQWCVPQGKCVLWVRPFH